MLELPSGFRVTRVSDGLGGNGQVASAYGIARRLGRRSEGAKIVRFDLPAQQSAQAQERLTSTGSAMTV
jgi:hypothetical protein